MIFTKIKIQGALIIDLELKGDSRGFFTRVFGKDELRKIGVKYNIVQINRSLTEDRGTIRGFHFQKPPYQEDKIVQCLRGSIFDVVLDLRKDSPTYGKWHGEVLSERNKRMLLIPKGCAHAFQTLENKVLVEYFVSAYYSPKHEEGVRWNDPLFGVVWPIKKAVLSDKDASWPLRVK